MKFKTAKVNTYLMIISFFLSSCISGVNTPQTESLKLTAKTWLGYKKLYISDHGRVVRIKNNDTVSEGQAYAMLRAAWHKDKKTFDTCYKWTEKNLSRAISHKDNLLAWHWQDGQIKDYMPASDADIDYALSLIFADSIWGNSAPKQLDSYKNKATYILDDILERLTYTTHSGRLYLSPWIIDDPETQNFPVNPSYYSPAHFKIFYQYTGDSRWLELVDTTYYILGELSKSFDGQRGTGLIPDWCSVNKDDKFSTLDNKQNICAYESVRISFRVGLDYFWFHEKKAYDILSQFSNFFEDQLRSVGAIYCEYHYSGSPSQKYEKAGFYSCYFYALKAADSVYADYILEKTRNSLNNLDENSSYYQDADDYYLNSLAWLADGYISGVVLNLYTK